MEPIITVVCGSVGSSFCRRLVERCRFTGSPVAPRGNFHIEPKSGRKTK